MNQNACLDNVNNRHSAAKPKVLEQRKASFGYLGYKTNFTFPNNIGFMTIRKTMKQKIPFLLDMDVNFHNYFKFVMLKLKTSDYSVG